MHVGQHVKKISDRLRVTAHVRRETHGHERIDWIFLAGGGDPAAVQEGAATGPRGEALIVQRIVDRRGKDLVSPRQRHRNAVGGEAVDVVAGAVERIDMPAKTAGIPRPAMAVVVDRFLADEAVVGESLEDDSPDLALRGDIGLGDEVARPLVRHAELAEPFLEHAAPGTRGRLTDLEMILHACR
jgi:hypothetical protein